MNKIRELSEEDMEEKMKRMRELVDLLNRARRAYEQEDTEIMSNYEYDRLYDELQELEKEAQEKYGLRILTAWTFAETERLKYQSDHAGANETSIVMAVRPELVDFGQVKEDESNLIGIAGRHPVRESSAAFGNEILEYTVQTLSSGIEKEYKMIKER